MTTEESAAPNQLGPQPPPIPPKDPIPPEIEPLAGNASLFQIYDALLKHPEQLIERLARGKAAGIIARTLFATALTWLTYGLVVGSFSGGVQWWAAPAKLAGGALAVSLLCLPSLFIFSCLSGADLKPSQAVGLTAVISTMTTMMLIGFAPVAWVFSQSTDSAFFMGMLHFGFWLIGLRFGSRLLRQTLNRMGAIRADFLRAWTLIFLLTSLQMTTALRPLLGTSDQLITSEKRFFLSHWVDTLQTDAKR